MSSYVHQRKNLSSVTKNLAAVAMGFLPADLLIRNGKLVNVNVGYIQEHIDVAVKDGFIAFVGEGSHIKTDEHTRIVDANNRYLVPGFIDSHMHIEASMIDPITFSKGVLPHGITTICPDNHEFTNIFGLKAVELFHNVSKDLPIKFLLAMPVCVPSIPGFEDSGSTIVPDDVEKAYKMGWAQLQGEQMNFPGLIFSDTFVHSINKVTLDTGMCNSGHYVSDDNNKGLNAFAACGINACHEVSTKEGTIGRAQLGIYPQMRHGTAWQDLKNCIKAYTENPGIDTRMFVMVTDDVTPTTILNDGQLLNVVREAIKLGVPPVKAVQFVTINPAQLLEKSRWIGSISPSRCADILIVSDINNMIIDEVYCDGVLVAENGKLTVDISPYKYPEWAVNSVFLDPLKKDDFLIKAPGDKKEVNVRVMKINEGEFLPVEVVSKMPVIDGYLKADSSRDLCKIFMFYRHTIEKAKGTRGCGFLQGVHFKENCAFASTVTHDCHHLLVCGNNDEAMKMAANEIIKVHGGFCVVIDNKVEAVMPLPLAGVMSLESLEVAAKQINDIEDALEKAGCTSRCFEMTFSVLGLVCVPQLHISNRGLVRLNDGEPPKIVDLIVE